MAAINVNHSPVSVIRVREGRRMYRYSLWRERLVYLDPSPAPNRMIIRLRLLFTALHITPRICLKDLEEF